MKKRSELAVLDASALLALLQGERGAERVEAVLGRAGISTVNLAEVATKFAREHAPGDLLPQSVAALEIKVFDCDQALAYAIGELEPKVRRRGLSLGDRACLALARRLGAAALTTDRAWAGLDLGVKIEVIR